MIRLSILILALSATCTEARIPRSRAVVQASKNEHPCPATVARTERAQAGKSITPLLCAPGC